MNKEEIDYCLEQFSKSNIGYQFENGFKITFFEVFNRLKEITQENKKLKAQLKAEEVLCFNMPDNIPIICMSKADYERNRNEYKTIENLEHNWNELKKFIKEYPSIRYSSIEKVDGIYLSGKLIREDNLLDKMQELERGEE